MMSTSERSYQDSKYFYFIFFVFLGPAFGLLQLKFSHILIAFTLAVILFTSIKKDCIKEKTFLYFFIFISVLTLYVLYAYSMLGIDARAVTYYIYLFISMVTIYLSYFSLKRVETKKLTLFLSVFFYLNCMIVLVEYFLGLSIFGFYPLSGTEFQVGSSFWSNVNTNVVVLLIANTSLFLLGARSRVVLNSAILLMISALVDAKLGIMATVLQLFFFLFYINHVVRLWATILLMISAPTFYILFGQYLDAIAEAIVEGVSLLSETELLERLVSSGELYSVAIRAYTLSEMLQILSNFEWFHWLMGWGFGSINISFYNEQWGGRVDYFSPHFFYLEMLIYGGILYYAMIFFMLKVLSGNFPWKYILLVLPTFGSIIAISSAVYFLPLYFLVGVLGASYQEERAL